LQRSSLVGKPAAADKAFSSTQAKPTQPQPQQQLDDAAKGAAVEEEEAGALPMVLKTGQAKSQSKQLGCKTGHGYVLRSSSRIAALQDSGGPYNSGVQRNCLF
jgi:hypothetical protein